MSETGTADQQDGVFVQDEEGNQFILMDNDAEVVPMDDGEATDMSDDDNEEEPEEGDEEEEDIPDDSLGVFLEHSDAIYCVDVRELPLKEEEPVTCVAITGSGDDTALMWDVGTGQSIHTFNHTDTVTSAKFNHDGTMVATASMDNTCRVYNSVTGELHAVLEGASDSLDWLQWHPRGNVLLAGGAEGICFMWLAINGKTMNFYTGHADALTEGMFTRDGKLIITSSADGSVRVWNPKSAECVQKFEGPRFHTGPINDIALSPNSPYVATASDDGLISLCNYENGKVFSQFEGHSDAVLSVAFCQTDNRFLVSGSLDGTVKVWDLASNQLRHTFECGEGIVNVVTHPTEPLLFASCLDRKIYVFDYRTCMQVKCFSGHRDVIHTLALIPNGQGFVAVSDDSTARVFALNEQ